MKKHSPSLSVFVCAGTAALLLGSGCNLPIWEPLPVPQISAGATHSCSVEELSGVFCWGDNSNGQLDVPAMSNPVMVAAGDQFSCALANSTVYCWGENAAKVNDAPVGPLANASEIVAGDNHACVLYSGGVLCWGDDSYGQISNQPALSNPIHIAAGANHSCAQDGNAVICWGDDSHGQVSNAPVSVSFNARNLTAGGDTSCIITGVSGGSVLCWGDGSAPANVNPDFVAAGAGGVCVVEDQAVSCSGDVAQVRELTRADRISVGGNHACAHHLQGVACWGDDGNGQVSYPGTPYYSIFHSESDIDAPPAFVWSILEDFSSYPAWNPFTISINNSALEIGQAVLMQVRMALLPNAPVQTQIEYIRVVEPGKKMCWGINTATPKVNSGERCQWIEALDGGTRTRYITEDLVAGEINPGVNATFGPSVQYGFDGVAAELKIRAEALYTP